MQLFKFESYFLHAYEFNDYSKSSCFWQIVIWYVIPATKSKKSGQADNTLALIVLFQYIPRLFVIFPLNQKIIKTTGFIAKTAWAGAAYNLLLYMLASHVIYCCKLLPVDLLSYHSVGY